ncbi:acyl-CoA dehydrogenase family protein [Roseomonas sp. BN140053]|uniref:acyl-CoA dehydrogenase family protein n=1 Tax=Roseomonas sp. BN140053 TaxID=3391898 RepID=UPI0039E89D20
MDTLPLRDDPPRTAPVPRGPDCPEARAAMLEAARAMAPVLRARAPETEALGRIPDSTVADFHAAGFFRILQPLSVGGYEFAPSVYLDLCGEIARSCASSSWVLANLAAHHLFMALWEPRAQAEVWGPSPDTLIGSSYVFSAGRAERAPGGWRVSGRWPFSSGIDPCQWTVVGASCPTGEGDARENRYFLLPRRDYEILDTWHVVGLRGTGSKDLEIRDAFVPDHRTLSFAQATDGTAPGLALHRGPLYRLPMQATGGFTLMATLYGAARGAVDDYVAGLRARVGRVGGKALSELTAVQTRIAEAEASLDTVEMISRITWDGAMRALQDKGGIDPHDAMRMKRDSAWCARLCVAAVDTVFAGAGGGGLFETSALQRHWRDVHAGAAQFGLQWDIWAPAYGRVRLGLPGGVPGIRI